MYVIILDACFLVTGLGCLRFVRLWFVYLLLVAAVCVWFCLLVFDVFVLFACFGLCFWYMFVVFCCLV